MSDQSPDMILHLLHEEARRRDNGERRTERLSLLTEMASRLEDWSSALMRRKTGPSRAEMGRIVQDLEGYWASIAGHR